MRTCRRPSPPACRDAFRIRISTAHEVRRAQPTKSILLSDPIGVYRVRRRRSQPTSPVPRVPNTIAPGAGIADTERIVSVPVVYK